MKWSTFVLHGQNDQFWNLLVCHVATWTSNKTVIRTLITWIFFLLWLFLWIDFTWKCIKIELHFGSFLKIDSFPINWCRTFILSSNKAWLFAKCSWEITLTDWGRKMNLWFFSLLKIQLQILIIKQWHFVEHFANLYNLQQFHHPILH